MPEEIRIFFVADIVGEPGLTFLNSFLPALTDKYKADFVIANAENSHDGRGTNDVIIKNLFKLGVHVVTGGNHSFDKHLVFPLMRKEPRMLRPHNYPEANAGTGYGIYDVPGKKTKIGVINMQGRTFLPDIEDPFNVTDKVVNEIRKETNLIFMDFHAEATAEKLALAWKMDGRISVFTGTHTHIPTGDARILPKGTGYITDAGMTGPFQSVLGMDIDTAIRRFTLATPQRYKLASDDNRICGVFAIANAETGKCSHIESVIYPPFQNTTE